MSLAVVGISHHTAPVEVRERLAFGASEASRALLALRDEGGIREAVLLSTCNRTEVYLFPANDEASLEAVETILRRKASGSGEADVTPFLFRQIGDGVVRHLFQVVAGLDSLVTGEAEIQGQVREAYERSTVLPVDPPMAGRVLNRLFQSALAVGGRVRAETSIGRGAASVASVAVELARKIFGSLEGKRVLILGAGATSEIIVEALSRHGVEGVVVANRTYDRAVSLARQVDGHAVPFEEMAETLSTVDIVLASTAAPHHVLTRELFRSAFPEGRRRPLLIIDIGVPRDVDPEVGEEAEVYLFNVDDLRQIVDEHVKIREGALPGADRIIAEHENEFGAWYAAREVVPVIRRMRRRAEDLRAHELARLFQALDHLDQDDRARVEDFSRRLMNKLLHDPTVRLRKGLGRHGAAGLVEAMHFLYGPGEGGGPAAPEGDGEPEGDGDGK
jgi:glutamyl-tRNA reductase